MISYPRLRAPILAATAISFLIVLLLYPLGGSTHEPITTNVRFNKEVIRILQRSCLDCHSAGKIKSDISLSTYEEARPWAKAIKEEVLEKRMPPYQAVRGFGGFSNDYGLSQRETDLLISWVEGGAPKGDVKDLPAARESDSGWALGRPDILLKPTREARISPDENSTKCFVLPTGFKEDRWLSGIEFKAGNERIVHSASISLVASPMRGRPLGACSPGPGSRAEFRKEQVLANWVPGQSATRFPSGVAREIPRGSQLLVRVRYQGSGEQAVDRSSVGLFLAQEAPLRNLTALTMTAPATSIAAAAGRVRVASTYTLATPAEAIGLRPILYPLARSIEATAYRPDGTAEILVWAKDRRFDWAPTYFFKKPVGLPAGTRVEVVAYLDNSSENPSNPHDPPKAIRFADPLCEVFLTQTPPAKMTAAAGRSR